MIIDINAFIGKWPYWPVRATSAAEVLQELSGWGIDQAAICSTRSVFVNWEDGNRETAEAVSGSAGVLHGFACIGPTELAPELATRPIDLGSYARQGFRGVRLYPQHHSYHPLRTPFVDSICEQSAALNWPVLLPLRIIMNWAMPSLQPDTMAALIERHPKTTWILAGINYLHELQMATDVMRRFETVHLETSCVMGFNAIPKLVEQCGNDRVLFGSGAAIQHGGANLSKVMRAKVTETARENILWRNAARLLDLPTCN